MKAYTADYWIKKLGLIPHPEGGFFIETLRSNEVIDLQALPNRYHSPRPTYTCIYYLLKAGQFSCFHRLKSDEIWHHYAGAPMCIHNINQQGTYTKAVVGQSGEAFHMLVPHSTWFATEAVASATYKYSLVGCSVAPAFDYDDWEPGIRERLLRMYPQHSELIHKFTYTLPPKHP